MEKLAELKRQRAILAFNVIALESLGKNETYYRHKKKHEEVDAEVKRLEASL